MMKKEKRECVVCGKKFTPKTANAKYCSEKCYKKQKAILDKNRKEKSKKIEKPLKKNEKKVAKVETKEVVKLPKKPAVKVEVVKVAEIAKQKEVLVHEGDFVCFVNSTPEHIMKFGMRLVKVALDHIHERENKEGCKCKKTDKKSCKCSKKVAKKTTKK